MFKKSLIVLGMVSVLNAETIAVQSGWNMFSAPTDIDMQRFDKSCVQYLWKYDVSGSDPAWQAYVVDRSLYYGGEVISTIKRGDGFWLKAAADCELEINDISLVQKDPNTPLLNQTTLEVQEESLILGDLNSTQLNTSFRIVGGDDQRFFRVSSDGKLSAVKALYTNEAQDINQDHNYNLVIETNSSGLTANNSLDVKIIPASEFKIVSKFYDEIASQYDPKYSQNGLYVPKVLGGNIESIEGNVTYSAIDGDAQMDADWNMNCSIDGYPSCGDGMTMDGPQPVCVSENTLNLETPSCISGVAVCSDTTKVPVCDDFKRVNIDNIQMANLDEHTNYAILLPITSVTSYDVKLQVSDGTKKADQNFTYDVVGMFTPPTPDDFSIIVNTGQWTKIDFESNLNISKQYKYEIIDLPSHGNIITKKDGSIWFNGTQADSFTYKIRYHDGNESVSQDQYGYDDNNNWTVIGQIYNNIAVTEQKTVTVEVQ